MSHLDNRPRCAACRAPMDQRIVVLTPTHHVVQLVCTNEACYGTEAERDQ